MQQQTTNPTTVKLSNTTSTLSTSPQQQLPTQSSQLPTSSLPPNQPSQSQSQLLDECNVFVKYLPPDLTDQQFHDLFKQYGKIVSSKIMVDQVTGKSLGYGFVRYSNATSSQKAIRTMNGQRVSNKRLLCKLANLSPSSYNQEFAKNPILNSQTPSNNLYIKPLNKNTNEEDLRQMFKKYGTIIDCKVMMDRNTGLSRQIGFVRFENKEHALRAIEEMNNFKIDPQSTPLTVKYADTKEQKTARKTLRQKQVYKSDRIPSSPPMHTTYYYYPSYGPYSPYSPYTQAQEAYAPIYAPSYALQGQGGTFQAPGTLVQDGLTWYNYGENEYFVDNGGGNGEGSPNSGTSPFGFVDGYYNELQFGYGYPEEFYDDYDEFEGSNQTNDTNENGEEPSVGEDIDDNILSPGSPMVSATPPIDIV